MSDEITLPELRQNLKAECSLVKPLNESAMGEARKYQDSLAMPPGSLGKIQDIGIKLAGISGKVKNKITKKRIIVLCADNGIVQENVSSAPQSVTLAQAVNMTRYKTGMSCMAKYFGCQVQVVDVGMACDYKCTEILNRKVAYGTKNFLKENALSAKEVFTAVLTGIELSDIAKKDGIDAVGVGEMGIGNTTSSTAVLCALTGALPESVTGRGGGITDSMLEHKIKVIEQSIKNRKPDSKDVFDVLSKLGGLDICAMAGVFIGCAKNRIPVVVDGYISVLAALVAEKICTGVKDFLFPSHISVEKGYALAAEQLELKPFLDMDMRLGEGSGCPFAFNLMEAACVIMNDMASFEKAGINDEYLNEVRPVMNGEAL